MRMSAARWSSRAYASSNLSVGDTLRLVGVGVQVTKVGKYKSAVEPYLGGTMSPEAKEQTEVLMNGLWKRILADVAGSRGMTPERLAKVVDAGGIFSARKAVELKPPTPCCTATNS
jgi:protease-4